jgi:hypothetical protein
VFIAPGSPYQPQGSAAVYAFTYIFQHSTHALLIVTEKRIHRVRFFTISTLCDVCNGSPECAITF